jgi:hypothetical protein
MTTTYAGFHEGLFCAVHEFTKENRTIHVVAGKKGTLTWSVNRFWVETISSLTHHHPVLQDEDSPVTDCPWLEAPCYCDGWETEADQYLTDTGEVDWDMLITMYGVVFP